MYGTASSSSKGVGIDDATPNGAGLFALADEIAGALGGPVSIDDPNWRLLAYSSTEYQAIDPLRADFILARKPPDWYLKQSAGSIRGRGDLLRHVQVLKTIRPTCDGQIWSN